MKLNDYFKLHILFAKVGSSKKKRFTTMLYLIINLRAANLHCVSVLVLLWRIKLGPLRLSKAIFFIVKSKFEKVLEINLLTSIGKTIEEFSFSKFVS